MGQVRIEEIVFISLRYLSRFDLIVKVPYTGREISPQ
jgi:hypothetical protein